MVCSHSTNFPWMHCNTEGVTVVFLFFFWLLISYFGFVSRFDFFADLQTKLQNPAKVVSVFDKVQMQGDKGAVATVDLSIGMSKQLLII